MMTAETTPIAPGHEGVIGAHEDGRAFIRFERRLDHPVERVWAALTEADRLIEWLGHQAEIDPREGGRLAIWLGGPGDPGSAEYTITVFDAPHVMEVEGGGEAGVLRWELRSLGKGCTLTFTHTLLPGERPENLVLAGWHVLLDQLPDALDGSPADWVALEATRTDSGFMARFEEIYGHYRNQPR
jgi:uncharacterized protein YndB with AHSA1/START domain